MHYFTLHRTEKLLMKCHHSNQILLKTSQFMKKKSITKMRCIRPEVPMPTGEHKNITHYLKLITEFSQYPRVSENWKIHKHIKAQNEFKYT